MALIMGRTRYKTQAIVNKLRLVEGRDGRFTVKLESAFSGSRHRFQPQKVQLVSCNPDLLRKSLETRGFHCFAAVRRLARTG